MNERALILLACKVVRYGDKKKLFSDIFSQFLCLVDSSTSFFVLVCFKFKGCQVYFILNISVENSLC